MGMSYTGFGAPVTTKNLQANADLNLGSYDLIATDVKGDTAEFDEFIGGVGNFTNVLGSGNLDIEGTANVKGLTTFQNGVQVNRSLHVEGSINNVNIADNGEITTAQGVNGADFNGAKITSTKFNGATIDASGNVTGAKGTFSGAVTGASVNGATITSTAFNSVTLRTGTLTVRPTSGTVVLPSHVETTSTLYHGAVTLLPYKPNVSYTGSIKFRGSTIETAVVVYTSDNTVGAQVNVPASSDYTYTFTGIRYLTAYTTQNAYPISFYNFTIT